MRKRSLQLMMVSAFCIALTGLTTAAPTMTYAADPTKTPTSNGGDYTVTTTELDLTAGPAATHAHLSPSGELFAYGNNKEICIYTIAGDKQKCGAVDADGARVRVDAESVVWSPDDSKLAFTSQFLITFNNPGLWIMDVASGIITKVTGIGYERASILKDNDLEFDLAPQWLPDSHHLLFLRYQQIKKVRSGPFVEVIDLRNGEITEQENLISESISIYLTGISADGKWLAYNNEGRGSAIEGGLWLYNIETKDFKKLFSIEKPIATPRVMSFNADATQILITDATDIANPTAAATSKGYDPAKSPVYIVDVATGEKMLVDDTRYVRRAGWSPDGKQIAYIVYDPIQQPDISGLYISTEPGTPGKLVLPGYFIVPTGREGQPILWASNNTLILSERERGFKLTVVKLNVK